MQNIPIRTELGREIRAAFVASPGRQLLSADYSQIELRILAHLSEDPILVEAFRHGEDIHSRTAQEVFGVLPLEQTREHRRVAKVINFGVIYGLSPFGLAQNLGIDTKEAAKFIAAYFERYSGVKKYLDRQIAETRKLGYTKTIFGRIRPMPEITSPQPNLRNFAERTAMNTPMQGAAADLIKLAMIELDRSSCRRLRVPNDPASPRRIPVRSARTRNPAPPKAREGSDGRRPQIARSLAGRNQIRPQLARHEIGAVPTAPSGDWAFSCYCHPLRLALVVSHPSLVGRTESVEFQVF